MFQETGVSEPVEIVGVAVEGHLTSTNNSGVPVRSLNWTYWALNGEDSFALLGSSYTGLANPAKEYTFLCSDQQGAFAVPPGLGAGQCGSTGPLPKPF
ncbi:MAG TPA: hypothetical protein VG204_10145 [Terriglobia bacterium]|nr:hypothetical protein [Terriglobia bacterium]